MAEARISAYLPPNIDPTKAPIAFGERALPKLNEELWSPDLTTRQRALISLCDLVHDPEYVYQAVHLGVIESLKALLCDENGTVRQKTTDIFYIMAGQNIGREGILTSEAVIALSKLLDDPVALVRRNMHQTFKMLSELPAGAVALVDAGLVAQLVSKLESEHDEIQEVILETLHFCLQIDATQALNAGAVPILKAKLNHPLASTRRKAACALMELSVPIEGKESMCKAEVVPILVQLLEDGDAEVIANVAGALMFITITTQGKYAALHSGAIPKLLVLVKHNHSKVRLNSLKALTTLSETPEGRRDLLQHVTLIQECLTDSSEAVRGAAATAVRIIQWKP